MSQAAEWQISSGLIVMITKKKARGYQKIRAHSLQHCFAFRLSLLYALPSSSSWWIFIVIFFRLFQNKRRRLKWGIEVEREELKMCEARRTGWWWGLIYRFPESRRSICNNLRSDIEPKRRITGEERSAPPVLQDELIKQRKCHHDVSQRCLLLFIIISPGSGERMGWQNSHNIQSIHPIDSRLSFFHFTSLVSW